jgi:hypothetical protein
MILKPLITFHLLPSSYTILGIRLTGQEELLLILPHPGFKGTLCKSLGPRLSLIGPNFSLQFFIYLGPFHMHWLFACIYLLLCPCIGACKVKLGRREEFVVVIKYI